MKWVVVIVDEETFDSMKKNMEWKEEVGHAGGTTDFVMEGIINHMERGEAVLEVNSKTPDEGVALMLRRGLDLFNEIPRNQNKAGKEIEAKQ